MRACARRQDELHLGEGTSRTDFSSLFEDDDPHFFPRFCGELLDTNSRAQTSWSTTDDGDVDLVHRPLYRSIDLEHTKVTMSDFCSVASGSRNERGRCRSS